MKQVQGFSKFTKEQKINWLIQEYLNGHHDVDSLIKSFWHSDDETQKSFEDFSENTLTNYYMPFGIAPNVVINNKHFCIPMVTEESSVVAAASKSAKFWLSRGGFKAEVLNTVKVGQVHFEWFGEKQKLFDNFPKFKDALIEDVKPHLVNMEKRGGGLLSLELKDAASGDEGQYQLFCRFETCDAMGANFINTVLETLGKKLKDLVLNDSAFLNEEKNLNIIMAILSNYNPECTVKAWVECTFDELNDSSLGMTGEEFAYKFKKAIRVAETDTYRATTHNKGIMNGIDSVVLATGNDFRAIEACAHTYATKSGQYSSLSHVEIRNNRFKFWIELPLTVGTVGGLTSLHPLAKISLDILGRPNAKELMEILAVTGLAQNFGAIKSLVTSGIQKGHMKMHLLNILGQFEASEEEKEQAKVYFSEHIVSFNAVREFLQQMRNIH